MHLAACDPPVLKAREGAQQLGLTYSYFNKVVVPLRKAGLIRSVQGAEGGYCLAGSPEAITLYDIIKIMEGEPLINCCLGQESLCSKYGVYREQCPVHPIFRRIQDEIVQILKNNTIGYIAGSMNTKMNGEFNGED